MDLSMPVKSIMSKQVITASTLDVLSKIKDILDQHNIHHIPILEEDHLVGIISKSDFLYFIHGFLPSSIEKMQELERLKKFKAKDLMTKNPAYIAPNDSIHKAINYFQDNYFHALPVLKNQKLVGILTTQDILKALVKS